MLNIGVRYVTRDDPEANIICYLHDVDVIPMHESTVTALYAEPPPLGTIVGMYSVIARPTLGGICKLNARDFWDLNGFVNFWGWGAEDRSLYNRAVWKRKNVKFTVDARAAHSDAAKLFHVFNHTDAERQNPRHAKPTCDIVRCM